MQICEVSEKRAATSVSVTCIFSSDNPIGVFRIDKMSSETYIRKLRGFNGESKENELFTLNTVHLQNPYKVSQRFEGFSNTRHNALKLQNNLLPKIDDVDKTLQVRKNTWTQDDINNILPTQKKKIQIAAYFILHLYNKWLSSPIIISMNPEPVSFEEFPFPSVTICNMNNAKKSEADRINNGNEDLDKLLLEDICNSRNETEIDDVFGSANWTNVLRFMINVSQPCNEMLHHCQWHGNVTEFHPETQPWRPYGAGKYYGLTLVLDTNIKEYYCSSTASIGFKLLLHNPVETPKMTDFGFAISPGEETRIVITPRINTASLSILGIPSKKRKCFFNTERKLKYYRTYTQRNCLLECEANFTQQICNCVQYYMPTNTGGLLGLFMGFSFLSVVEIFYFITLRLWCRIQWNERSKCTDHRKTSDIQPKIVYPFSQ
ncbi:hypothetical protein G9C98_006966 [Cotesia typhae]|uniref:Uncharacterized protein n=1 Tax=Cotesia typhae TaxID=2053667 RepID=A0A8J5UTG3_9HYME|nr:hypothetical protein G9C98_006966 [Cotesia typhae]